MTEIQELKALRGRFSNLGYTLVLNWLTCLVCLFQQRQNCLRQEASSRLIYIVWQPIGLLQLITEWTHSSTYASTLLKHSPPTYPNLWFSNLFQLHLNICPFIDMVHFIVTCLSHRVNVLLHSLMQSHIIPMVTRTVHNVNPGSCYTILILRGGGKTQAKSPNLS